MNKPAVIFSAFLSAIILTIIGGVVYTVRGTEPTPVLQAVSTGPIPIEQSVEQIAEKPVEQSIASDPTLEQELLAREVAYQEMIAEANARLAEQQAAEATQVSTPAPVLLQITAQEASVFASNHLGQSQVYSVEVVNYNTKVVYKVTFSSGDVAFVTRYGDVISVERAVKQPDSRQSVASNSGGGQSGEQEHDDDDDHDDDD
ncbi:MAG: hypothetical protein HN413_04245 [Chloroflexi bacterium]|nr:hypothetical protein [Chloroflexota bacterium]